MTIIKNQGPENTSEFYKCSNEECDHKEIPYIAQILGYNPQNFYQHFEKILATTFKD